MPYIDTEKNREYQRLWAKNKKDKRMRSKGRDSHYKLEDGSFNLNRRVVTWAELNQDSVDKIQTWEECVKKASGFVFGRRINRLQIAALAIRACVIKQGGNRKGDWINDVDTKKNLTNFATKIKVNRKTLSNWVYIKVKIIDQLDHKREEVNWTAAAEAWKNIKKFSSPSAAYKKFDTQDPFERRANDAVRYLKNAASILSTFGNRGFSEDQIKESKIHIKHILQGLNG